MRSNFLDNPSDLCDCGFGAEDLVHFLLGCNNYAISRQKLLFDVQDILGKFNLITLLDNPQVYLYGDHKISDADNTKILLVTIIL